MVAHVGTRTVIAPVQKDLKQTERMRKDAKQCIRQDKIAIAGNYLESNSLALGTDRTGNEEGL